MRPDGRPVFICWTFDNGRSRRLAEALSAEPLFLAERILSPLSAPLRYLRGFLRTLIAVLRRRPAYVVVMVPPFPAVVACYLATRLVRRPLVLDLHTGVLNDPKWSWSWPMTRWVARRCAATVVTTDDLADHIRRQHVNRVIALHDLPEPLTVTESRHQSDPTVVAVTSWSNDEPVAELIEAARALPGVRVVLTGRAPSPRPTVPDNVVVAGWLSNDDYMRAVRGADVVVALTTREWTMQRGGYEALAAARPLVTSDTKVLREFFGPAAAYAVPQAVSIATAIRLALDHAEQMSAQMRELHEKWTQRSTREVEHLREVIAEAASR